MLLSSKEMYEHFHMIRVYNEYRLLLIIRSQGYIPGIELVNEILIKIQKRIARNKQNIFCGSISRSLNNRFA